MSRGATFKKADLHLHAPGTGQNFRLGEGRDLSSPKGRKAFAQEYVRKAREKGLDIIAITNHNDTSWIDPIREAARELEGEIGPLVVFPGVEVGSEAGESIHILAIFDRNTLVFEIERFLADIGLESERRFTPAGNVCPSSKSFTDIVNLVHDRGGIAIAAHAFSDENSLLGAPENRGLAREQQFRHSCLLGLDLGHHGSLEELEPWEKYVVTNTHYTLKRERPIGCLSSSDAHSLEEIGEYFSWIKCEEEITLETLRRALLDPEARLRLRDERPAEPKYVISRLEVENTGTGFLRGLSLEFNERLNCLIGGRGTGKSAIIELLRYLWEQEPPMARRKEWESFRPVFFPETARAQVDILVREGVQETRYRFRREGHRQTEVYQLVDGNEIPKPDLRPQDVFRLDIFGQKEILFTSQDIRSQLKLLDRMCGREVEELNEEEQSIQLSIRHIREEMIYLARRIEEREARLVQLPALQERLRRIQVPEITRLEEDHKHYQQEEHLWQKVSEELDKIARAMSPDSRPRVDTAELNPEQTNGLPSAEVWGSLWRDLNELNERVDESFGRLLETVEFLQGRIKQHRAEWEARRRESDARYYEKMREMGIKGEVIDEIARLEREIADLKRLESEVKTLKAQLRSEVEKWMPAVEALQKIREDRFKRRDQKAQEITKRLGSRVRITIEEQGDREALVEELRKILAGSRLRDSDYKNLAEMFRASLLGMLASIEQADQQTEESLRIFTRWLSESPSLDTFGLEKFQRVVKSLGWEQRLEFAEYGVPDRVTIEVNIGTAERPIWRTVGPRIGEGIPEGVSVGQGCTAILSLILLETPFPLILDQPEDDLDNRFIYDEIVQILRRERGHRQMIIATHNPNIPVAGDAELIIALSAQEEHEGKGNLLCRVEASGFIDNNKVVEQVIQILDGGRQAFELRRQKYGF